MNEYKEKHVLVIGLARSGLAAIKLLLRLGARVTLSEAKKEEDIKEASFLRANGVDICGQEDEVFERNYDIAIKNPGISGKKRFIERLRERGIPVTTEIELAFSCCAPQHFIAVTGTNGKTTTTTLLNEILSAAYPSRVHLCGNIGIPLCDIVLSENLLENAGHYIVLEISNFQLLDIIKFRPEIAVILNLAPDHLDFMGSEDAYYRSKARVYENMIKTDIFLENIDDDIIKEYTSLVPVKCNVKTFSLKNKADFYADDAFIYAGSDKIMPVSDIKIVGRHNVQNVLVAAACAAACSVENEIIASVVSTFHGVEHRIEFVREKDGVRYYNDSKGTNVDATVTAVKAFPGNVILLAGGYEKQLPFEPMKPFMKNVKKLIAYGACGERLKNELAPDGGILTDTLSEALKAAVDIAGAGDVVLLSPTTSSYDQFSCFEERGDYFKELVNKL